MSGGPATEDRIASRIPVRPKVSGGPWFVELRGPDETVFLGPYENPALARDDARRIAGFVLGVLREEWGVKANARS
jgi:hypothetical protein